MMTVDDFVGAPFDREYSLELGSLTRGLSEAENAQEGLYRLLVQVNMALESYFSELPFYIRIQLGTISLDDAIFDIDTVKDKIDSAFDALRQADASIEEAKNSVLEAETAIGTAVNQWVKESSNYEDDDQDAREMDRYVKENYMV